MRDAVLAAQEHALEVHVLHVLPSIGGGLERGSVVARRDACVVEEHVNASERLARAPVHVRDLALLRDVDLQREIAGSVLGDVGAHHLGALALEERGGRRADSAGGARDDADLALEPHEVAMKIDLTSV